jgi:copper oxidase (laccase) domain-containing protein
VGDEVRGHFDARFADNRMLDLRAVADHLLQEAGVERVEHVDLCTSCRGDLFFSHRRDGGVTGRQGGLVWRA